MILYDKTREALLQHYQNYPHLQMTDLLKFIHQSAFGCEHMISSAQAATEYIRTEYQNHTALESAPLVEPLDGAYSRVHLSYLNHGLRAETLGKLFYASAKAEPNGIAEAENKLSIAKTLAQQTLLPFEATAFESAVQAWKDGGYPSVHHSDQFRSEYRPAYRVISNKYVPFLPLFAKLDSLTENGNVVVAIEGGSASGKSTLGTILKTLYDCNIFHTDDFFLRPEQRTQARYAEIGGNLDYERFAEEILLSLRRCAPITYRKFDCSTMTLSDAQTIVPKKLSIVEGVYSMHPHFGEYFDLSVFLDISPALQKERIAKRNPPQLAKQFYEKWIPLENLYFSKLQVKNRCDLILPIQ